MTHVDPHTITINDEQADNGATFWRVRCSCGLLDAITIAKITAAKYGADHHRAVEQLTEHGAQL